MPRFKLTYFDFRGRFAIFFKFLYLYPSFDVDTRKLITKKRINNIGSAEPIRMLFSIAGIPLEDKRVTFAEWPEAKKCAFFSSFFYKRVSFLTLCQKGLA